MKVFDLQCTAGHQFEGWFGSDADFTRQSQDELIACPLCGDTHVVKKLSAPRLNLGHAKRPVRASRDAAGTHKPEGAAASATRAVAAVPARELQAAWLKMVRAVMAHTEDVGERFAEEARRMHYGEAEERGIRGQATLDETRALLEEGIEVAPLPIPENLKGKLQ